jgi:PAS domain S-box-containing protein
MESESRTEGHDLLSEDDPVDLGTEPEVLRWLRAYAVAEGAERDAAVASFLTEANRLLRGYRMREARRPAAYDAQLRMLVEQMPAVLWTTDAEVRVTSLTGGGLAALGAERMPGGAKPLAAILGSGESASRAMATHARALRGESSGYEIAFRDRVYSALVGPLVGPDGAIGGPVGVALDINERRRAEEALERRERQLADAQRLARLGSWEWHRGDAAATWSPELYRIWGLDPRTFRPTVDAIQSRVHPDDRAEYHAVRDAALRAGRTSEGAFRIIRPNGEVRHLSVLMSASRDADGQPTRVHGVCQDITERVRAERERADQRERQARLDGMLFAVRELASRVSRTLAAPGAGDTPRSGAPASPSLAEAIDAAAALSRALDDIAELRRMPGPDR